MFSLVFSCPFVVSVCIFLTSGYTCTRKDGCTRTRHSPLISRNFEHDLAARWKNISGSGSLIFLQEDNENLIIENSCVRLPTNYHQYSKAGGNLTFILPNNVLYIPTMLWMIARPAKKNKTFYQQFLFKPASILIEHVNKLLLRANRHTQQHTTLFNIRD